MAKISITGLERHRLSQQKREDIAWSVKIRERDNWCCAICGNTFGASAHHIIPRENKEFRYFEDNGITLCVKHHKFSRVISAHNNPMAFFLWLQKYRYPLFCTAVERQIKLCEKECVL